MNSPFDTDICYFSFSSNGFSCINGDYSFRCNCSGPGYTQPYCEGKIKFNEYELL